MNIAAEVAKRLLQINAIKLSPQKPFTWASGLRSPIYCDNRVVLSYPGIRRFIIDSFASKAEAFQPFGLVAGVATAGIAHGVLLAEQLSLPFVYVRDKAKGHGRQNQIEGEVKAGARVLVIEDLISTGGSCLKAVDALREAGCEVAGVLAIFSYGFQQATEAFQAAHCPFDTLSHYDALIEVALAENKIGAEAMEALRQWRLGPQAWSAAFA
ncbi:MAG: orotate phosphoribosyltransferase [Phaeodactylibacter sp.]|nr:orotate phosphoribosyltransferase [Phaeodactylibacter sp.]MCB9274667.1 orotate phosphoribosyltransferase [Lewinellaceae bacterium]